MSAHPRPAAQQDQQEQSSAVVRALRAVPDPATGPTAPEAPREPRGLVLHVILSDESAGISGTELAEVAELLRETAEELLPAAATYTTLSLGAR